MARVNEAVRMSDTVEGPFFLCNVIALNEQTTRFLRKHQLNSLMSYWIRFAP